MRHDVVSHSANSAAALLQCVDALRSVSDTADEVATVWSDKVITAHAELEALCEEEAMVESAAPTSGSAVTVTVPGQPAIDAVELAFGAAVYFIRTTPAYVEGAATADCAPIASWLAAAAAGMLSAPAVWSNATPTWQARASVANTAGPIDTCGRSAS